MPSSEIAIRVSHVSKHYAMFAKPEDRLKQMVMPRLQRLARRPLRRYFTDFAAVNDVSFEVKRGETVGIIGRNGSGKSTTLQMVCGTLQPTSGAIEVNGRIAALLELGAGFNPEFTGRENVYLNAAILGLSRSETDERFDDIARFADIGIFIDQPVKTYSSGMYVRLAFAVAINVDPDILVVDEALSVGDEAFQRKCFARIEDIRDKGGTILFVTHGAQTIVQLCDRAMLFDRGELLLEGKPKTVVNQYHRYVNLSGPTADVVRAEIKGMEAVETAVGEVTSAAGERTMQEPETENTPDEEWYDPSLSPHSRIEYESSDAKIRDVQILTLGGRRINVLQLGGRYVVSYRLAINSDTRKHAFGMQIKTVNGLVLAGSNNLEAPSLGPLSAQEGDEFDVRFEFDCRVLPGVYVIDTGVMAMVHGEWRFIHRVVDALMFRVTERRGLLSTGHFDLNPSLSVSQVKGHDPAKSKVLSRSAGGQ